ncbi:hypothetical protein MUU72_31700 [Streptomyces sp. RS10V-4]|uniref:hypothetical protein n=1 Tax=Streptomyces rhizoryzae TaxID=2932493 RepID=UPI002006D776|nr:hypothetical protein [Streptomyces rhizoryzae]MCK7627607.1 hypothetical protein [Streptomyces rhizoryzae]
MTATTTTSVAFAGHVFDVEVDQELAVEQRTHLHNFVPETALSPPCGRLTGIRVRHNQELFVDRAARLRTVPSRCVEPFRGEPYLWARVGDVDWCRPHARSHLSQDHLYAHDSTGRLHVVLHPDAHRGERYLLRVIREVVMRCGEERGWAAFHAAAASVEGHGVLIAGPTTAGKTTVLAALACHRGADLVASDRAMLTQNAADVIGVPLSIRVAGGTLSALTPREALPPHRVLPRTFGTDQKASCTPRDFAAAFAAQVREGAPLRLALLPRLLDDDTPLSIRRLHGETARAELAATCCTPDDEDWLHPWFAHRTRSIEGLRAQAGQVLDDLVANVPVFRVTAGVRIPHLLERLADTVTRRLS